MQKRIIYGIIYMLIMLNITCGDLWKLNIDTGEREQLTNNPSP
jgi:hypothetical protein